MCTLLYTQAAVFPLIQVAGPVTGNTILKNLGITSDKQMIIGKEVPENAVRVVK